MSAAVVSHRIADISKRGDHWEVLCECGTTVADPDQTAARIAHREHVDGGVQPEEAPVVSLEEYRNGQEPEPDDADSGAEVFRCTEPGCGREFSRPNGLSRHTNQSHGDSARTREKSSAKAGGTRKRHVRHEAPPEALEAVGYQVALTLDSERTDVLAALAFIEERDADDLIREALCAWLATEAEAEPGLAALAAARARRRG